MIVVMDSEAYPHCHEAIETVNFGPGFDLNNWRAHTSGVTVEDINDCFNSTLTHHCL